VTTLKSLVTTANYIKPIDPSEKLNALKKELTKLTIPGKLKLPLDPRIEVTSLVLDKCKYMDSKKVKTRFLVIILIRSDFFCLFVCLQMPLWLVFKNSDPFAPGKYVIFKSGDDLRQDML
jgi:phosphatidylinositol-4,5-bisphosphate 3-kinase